MAVRTPLYGVNFVNTRANLLGVTELVEQAALDKYTFVRDGYLQRRQYLIENGAGPRKLPEYEDAVPAPVKPSAQ
jgi:phospholipid-binding lipoprotein MlaA